MADDLENFQLNNPGVRFWINPDNSSSEDEVMLTTRSSTPDPLVEIRARRREREAIQQRRHRSISNSTVSSVSSDSSVSSASSVSSIPYSVTSSEAGPVNVATQFPELTEMEENVLRGLGLIGFADSDGFDVEVTVEVTVEETDTSGGNN